MRTLRFLAMGAVLLVIAGQPSWAAQQSLPAELYQLLEDAKWLKEQGRIEEARAKLAEYDRRVADWRVYEEESKQFDQAWIEEVVAWAAEVEIEEGLRQVESEIGAGLNGRARFRLIALRNRLKSGVQVAKGQCLYGTLAMVVGGAMQELRRGTGRSVCARGAHLGHRRDDGGAREPGGRSG